MRPHERPADVVLTALRRAGLDYGCTETGAWAWRATCPSCRGSSRRSLHITEPGGIGSPISVRCSNGCTEHEVIDALTAAVRDTRETSA
ncbi:MAG: hypothetical protein ACR2NB_09565 [Solirubrobacteraceae bacterium]